MHELRTSRLLLRQWREEDVAPYVALNGDPQVMEFFPRPFTPKESRAQVERFSAALAADLPGIFAAERRADGAFVGFIGLAVPQFEAAFTPCVEIGWRLAVEAWGKGLATEGALAVREHAFGALGLEQIVSFTSRLNVRSQAVMRKIGMHRDADDDFDHPRLEPGDPLRPHVLYRLSTGDEHHRPNQPEQD